MNRTLRALLVVATLGLAACGGSEPEAAESCELPTSEAADLSLLPEDIPLADWGVVDEIHVESGFLGARAITETSIVELYPVIARATVAADYTILSGDNEGFEAEIFFERGEGTTGTYRLREGPCEDQVTIRLLYESERYRRMS